MRKFEAYPRVYHYQRIVQAKLYMDKNFSSQIDLDNISNEACFSKFHFIRLFKSVYGKTPHQYLTAVRLEKAKLLLQDGNTIGDTCYKVGFESISSFAGLFRRYTAFAPSAYQKQFFERQLMISQQPLRFVPNCFATHLYLNILLTERTERKQK